MEFNQLLDLLRATHLIFFAAGMGTGLYFDFRAFAKFNEPLDGAELEMLESIHWWISWAVAGLWLTGVALIYVRTAFDLSAFSPKLWLKLTLMTFMSANSILIGTVVLSTLRNNIGKPMSELPLLSLMGISQLAILSMYLWTSGLMLGSSVVLKTASWDVLIPLAVGWLGVLTVGGQFIVLVMRRRARSQSKRPIPA